MEDNTTNNTEMKIDNANEKVGTGTEGESIKANDNTSTETSNNVVTEEGSSSSSTTQENNKPEFKSFRCVETGRLFANATQMQIYAERTGRTEFEQSTEEVKPKTKEELEAAKQALILKAKEKQAQNKIAEKKRQQQAELKRRREGKLAKRNQEEWQAVLRKREAEARAREKARQRKERERLKKLLEQDKKERQRQAALRKGLPVPTTSTATTNGTTTLDGAAASGASSSSPAKKVQKTDSTSLTLLTPEEAFVRIEGAVKLLVSQKLSDTGKNALKLCQIFLSNVLKNPENPKFRKIKLTNKTVQKKIIPAVGAIKLLMLCGFVKDTGDEGAILVIPSDAKPQAKKIQKATESIAEALKNLA
eukprot:g24.t1